MRPVAIIQARMGSSRLPGKVLADLGGAPMLARMVTRVRRATSLVGIVIATTTAARDAPIRRLATALGVGVFAGSETDVLDRYVGAATAAGADPIVRLTADCPLIDPRIIDACVARFMEGGWDHVALGGAFPDGLDTEVIAAAALTRAHAEATHASDREHVTPYVWRHPDRFRCTQVPFPRRLGWRRWTVDEPRDLAFVRAVWDRLGGTGAFGWEDVEALCRREPALAVLNAGIARNAGYRESLAREARA